MFHQMKYGPNGYEPIHPERPDDPNYKVGYQNPPKKTRFKKGQSGNPKGAAKRRVVTDLRVLFDEILAEEIKIPQGGRLQSVTKLEAIIHAYMNTGLAVNPRTV